MPRRVAAPVLIVLACAGAVGWYAMTNGAASRYSDAEAGFGDERSVLNVQEDVHQVSEGSFTSLPPIDEPLLNGRIRWSVYWQEMTPEETRAYGSWQRPPGPLRVGIQAGHWQLDDLPEELEGLRASSGAQGGGYSEQETVLEIARRTQEILEVEGIVVDLLPAAVPIDYIADAFVSIHADGSTNTVASGYKIASPRRDFSGKAQALVDALYESYGAETGLRRDTNITRRMSAYYAFNWRRYDHALHPMTPAAIVETGFMTNAADRTVIVGRPEAAARGIAEGILAFLGR